MFADEQTVLGLGGYSQHLSGGLVTNLGEACAPFMTLSWKISSGFGCF